MALSRLIQVHDAKTGYPVRNLRPFVDDSVLIVAMLVSPLNATELLAVGSNETLATLHINDGTVVSIASCTAEGGNYLSQLSNGQMLVATSECACVALSPVEFGGNAVVKAVSHCGGYVAAFAPKSKHVSLVNMQNGTAVTVNHDREVTSVSFHPSQCVLAVADKRGQIRLYQFESYDQQPTSSVKLHWHSQSLSAISFSPDGAYLYSGGSERVLVRWHLETRDKTFLPRMSAPIKRLMVADSSAVYVTLMDNRIVTLNAMDWSVVADVVGIKFSQSNQEWRHGALHSRSGQFVVDAKTGCALLNATPGSLQSWNLQSNQHDTDI